MAGGIKLCGGGFVSSRREIWALPGDDGTRRLPAAGWAAPDVSLFRRWRHRWGVSAALGLVLSSISMWGCASVQWLDAAGRPHSFGLATVAPMGTDDGVTRITAPGAALRLIPGLEGYSIGWRETVLFQSRGASGRETVAFADHLYGVAIDATQIVFGTAHQFAILEPPGSAEVIQEIRYTESDPASVRIRRQEVK